MGNHEDQGDSAPGAQVLGVDRRKHLVVPFDLPADVDLQDRVRRERPDDRPPQVLLGPRRCTRQRPCQAGQSRSPTGGLHDQPYVLIYISYFGQWGWSSVAQESRLFLLNLHDIALRSMILAVLSRIGSGSD